MRCLGVCNSPNYFALLFEYVRGGDLSDLLDSDEKPVNDQHDDFSVLAAPAFVKWQNRLDICLQISSGMAFLHGKGVIHFDIKPDNILLELTPSEKLKCKVLLFIGFQ